MERPCQQPGSIQFPDLPRCIGIFTCIFTIVVCSYKLEPEQVRAAVRHALERVGLADFAERPSHTLSGGQKQRCAPEWMRVLWWAWYGNVLL